MFDILYGISALELSEQYAIFGVLGVALIGLWYTWFLKKQVMANDSGSGNMVEVWTAIKEGAEVNTQTDNALQAVKVEATMASIIFLLPRIAAIAGFSPFSRCR